MRSPPLTIAFLVLLAVGNSGIAQLPGLSPRANPKPPAPVESNETRKAKRASIAQELRVARRSLESAQNGSTDASANGGLTREVELLKQLDALVAQQDSAKSSEQELVTRKTDLAAELEAVRTNGPKEQPPYSFVTLDELRDALASHLQRSETVEAAVASASDAVVAARSQQEDRAQAVRRLRDGNVGSAAADGTNASLELKVAELESRLASETLTLRKQLLANEQLNKQIHDIQKLSIQEQINWVEQDVEFSQAEFQDQLVELEKQEDDLRRSLASAESNLQFVERQLFEIRQQLDSATGDTSALVEEVEAKRLARQKQQQQIATYNIRLQRLSDQRETWNRRFQVVNELATTEELVTWKAQAEDAVEQLAREKRIQHQRIDELRSQSSQLDKKLQAADGVENVTKWVRAQQHAIQQLIKAYDANSASIDASQRLQANLLAEIQDDVEQWTLSEWGQNVWNHFVRIWNTELAKFDERPITVGKVFVGLLLVIGGFFAARLLSRIMGQRLLRSFGLDEGASSAIQSVSFYVLLVLFTLTSLRFVNVPLTIFTLLGGAVAIGVGFGSQNILNNFISGLILLAERPIKVGDLIQLEGLYGNVVKIGARSTQIRTGDNLDIIVPNSKFLENNVINLTLGDDKIRTHINVGVVYGSPTREVARFLQRAVEEHGQVLNTPKPFVWFVDFGDNSLNFQVHFWVKARTMAERIRLESDVRYRIDQLFRDANIVIAYPQRDIHVDTLHPIDIRLIGDPPLEAENDSGPRSAAA